MLPLTALWLFVGGLGWGLAFAGLTDKNWKVFWFEAILGTLFVIAAILVNGGFYV